jgi:hypothetical protein
VLCARAAKATVYCSSKPASSLLCKIHNRVPEKKNEINYHFTLQSVRSEKGKAEAERKAQQLEQVKY